MRQNSFKIKDIAFICTGLVFSLMLRAMWNSFALVNWIMLIPLCLLSSVIFLMLIHNARMKSEKQIETEQEREIQEMIN